MSATDRDRRRVVSTCYMCEAPETSREHVPAACFFPEQKDLPPGMDLRRNLFTVPSCDAHNGHKSKDDQFLWQVITATRGLNECGELMVRTKVRRSISERPALVESFMRTATPVHIYEAGEWHETVRARIDTKRQTRVLEHLGRALHFLHFGRKWPGVVGAFPSFMLFDQNTNAPRDFRSLWRTIIERTAAEMARLERIGENQDAFYYQVMPPERYSATIMRATFYGGPAITYGFLTTNAGESR